MNAQTKIEAETILGALAIALPKLEAAKKNSNNPHFKSTYADLKAVIAAIYPIAEYGLWYRQVSHEVPGGVSIETFYIHASGELSAGCVFVPADKNNAQGYGSAQTYARRYGLQLAFGLATEDDDGNAASAPRTGANQGRSLESAVSPDGPALVDLANACIPVTVKIDDVQWSQLAQLMKASGADAKKFLAHYAITDLRDLPATSFSKARDQLNTKLAKKVKEETNKQGFGEVLADEIPY